MAPESLRLFNYSRRLADQCGRLDVFHNIPMKAPESAADLSRLRASVAEAAKGLSELTQISTQHPDFLGLVEMFGTGWNRGGRHSYWQVR